ncbi:MAG: hypothetical protein ACYTFG_07005, partial [Planctomycetota bacterium]
FYTNLDKASDQDFSDWALFRQARERAGELARFAAWRARTREEALTLDNGHGLSESLVLAAYGDSPAGKGNQPPPSSRISYGSVIDHELMHVRDANRYLPITRHPLTALGLGVRHGFSQTSIEAKMEERAALAALIRSPQPHLALRHLLDFAPYPEAQLPHSRGFCRLLSNFLAVLYEREDLFPALDRRRNLCRQLHLLSREEIWKVARILARREGILE